MPNITLRRQPVGKPVSAGVINECIGWVERLLRMRVGAGLAMTSVSGIPLLRALGTFTSVRWVYTQAAGIGYATSTTAGSIVTNTPQSAVCWDSKLDATTSAWTVDTSTTPGLTVYNDWTSTMSTSAGVGGKWICVGTAPDGTTRCLGDPC